MSRELSFEQYEMLVRDSGFSHPIAVRLWNILDYHFHRHNTVAGCTLQVDDLIAMTPRQLSKIRGVVAGGPYVELYVVLLTKLGAPPKERDMPRRPTSVPQPMPGGIARASLDELCPESKQVVRGPLWGFIIREVNGGVVSREFLEAFRDKMAIRENRPSGFGQSHYLLLKEWLIRLDRQ